MSKILDKCMSLLSKELNELNERVKNDILVGITNDALSIESIPRPEGDTNYQSPPPLGKYITDGVTAIPIKACVPQDRPLVIAPSEYEVVPTGYIFSVSDGKEMHIRPKSGLAIKHGVTLLGAPMVINSSSKDELMLPIINLGKQPFTIHWGDVIAEAKIHNVDFIFGHNEIES